MDEKKFEEFQARLEELHSWPCVYLFKFIVPRAGLSAVAALFEGHPLITKDSSGGKYVSVTAQIKMASSAEVTAVYRKAARIEGVISL